MGKRRHASVAETMCASGGMVDTPASGAGSARCGGSSPLSRTKLK